MTAHDLLTEYKAGKRDFSDANLSNTDLRNANLRFADLSNAYLSNACLSNANLRNTDLRGADLSNACLSNADLSNTDLRNACLSNANLRGANLEHNKTVIYACLGGYVMFMNEREGKLMVKAGCRYFDVAEAREHWAEGNESEWSEKTAEYGQRQRDMLEFLVIQAVALDWESANTYRQG